MSNPGPQSRRRRVLLIAYHFPPVQGSSGVQRTLRFAQHLPKFGWQPVVLTITPNAYADTGCSAGNEVPEGVEVHRAFGLDAARQLRFAGRYPGFLAVPDRWRTWQWWAVPKGRTLLANGDIQAIWSTFPVATAHRIGLELARESLVPWIAEFRDPMWQGAYPEDPATNQAFRELETHVVKQAQAVVMTTFSAAKQYRMRFGPAAAHKMHVIENGFDEDVFARAERAAHATPKQSTSCPLVLLHSGVVYRNERDPAPLFEALARLKRIGIVTGRELQIVFRASGHDSIYQTMLREQGIEDIVRLEPPVHYLQALQEMLTVDALLVMQASNCNAQIPAKLYEYLRAGKPMLGLTDPNGDTGRKLLELGMFHIARLDSVDAICELLPKFVADVRDGRASAAPREAVMGYSREAQTGRLAALLDELCARKATK